MKKNWTGAVTLLSVAALLSLGAARAQEPPSETFLLKDQSAAGDVSDVESDFSMSMDMKATFEGRSVPAASISSREREKYREEVLSRGAGGVTALRRTYSIAREAEKGPDGQKVKVSSLQGKTIVLKKLNGKTVLTVAKGKVAPADRKELMDDLDNAEMAYFPETPVKLGEEWSVDAARLRATFGDLGKDGKAEMRGRVMEVVQYQGQRCARVAIELHVEGQGADPYRMSMDLSGDLYHALDLQRTLSVQATGPLTLKGSEKDVKITGEGIGRFTWTHRPLKLAGKPVTLSR